MCHHICFIRAKLQMLSRKTENLAEFGPELARKTDRTANTTRYLQQELSALKEISAQVFSAS